MKKVLFLAVFAILGLSAFVWLKPASTPVQEADCSVSCYHGNSTVSASGRLSCTCSWWGYPAYTAEAASISLLSDDKQKDKRGRFAEEVQRLAKSSAEKDFLAAVQNANKALDEANVVIYQKALSAMDEAAKESRGSFKQALQAWLKANR